MTIATELTTRTNVAANYLAEHGWTQDQLKSETGQVCATGAVMYCRPKDGDEQIIIQVLRHRGRAENWNDEDGRTAEEVEAALRADITDEELEATFGPQWESIVALVRRAAVMAKDEGVRLATVRAATWVAARDAAQAAGQAAARDAARDAAWAAAQAAARAAARGATQAAAWAAAWATVQAAARDAAWDATWALVVRDLIGEHGFTQEHYDTLTRPWASVIGPVHPEDAPLHTTTEGSKS